MFQVRRAGTRQNEDILGSHHFLLIMKHTPPPLVFRPWLFCPAVKQKVIRRGYRSVRDDGVRHASVKQRLLQSLMSRWKLILALRSSILFSKDWTLASRILGRGGLGALFLSLLRIPARFPRCFLPSWDYSGGLCSPRCSEVSPMATLDP